MKNIDDSVTWTTRGDNALTGTRNGKQEVGELWGQLAGKSFSSQPHDFIADGDKVVVLTTVTLEGETMRTPTSSPTTPRASWSPSTRSATRRWATASSRSSQPAVWQTASCCCPRGRGRRLATWAAPSNSIKADSQGSVAFRSLAAGEVADLEADVVEHGRSLSVPHWVDGRPLPGAGLVHQARLQPVWSPA